MKNVLDIDVHQYIDQNGQYRFFNNQYREAHAQAAKMAKANDQRQAEIEEEKRINAEWRAKRFFGTTGARSDEDSNKD